MKLLVLNSIPTTLAFTLASTITFSSPSHAQALSFICGTINDEPAIIAQTAQGNIPVVRWVSDNLQFLDINSRSHCEQMADQLQKDCLQPTNASQQRGVCAIGRGSRYDNLGTNSSEQLPPLWGQDIQLSQSPAKLPRFPVYIQMNFFLNVLPAAVAVPSNPNIFIAPASGGGIQREPEPTGSLW
ncbi:COP23 domain-containing protein [Tychonema sp. BBK16]|uniref:COP23 domain-containing protein n=1 Tax=Tychonema sp. BBK16 TaxID=2699888 RepID=UPI001F2BDE5F|nr:COP23 domain-containing protein [Tychonema sp. BBK16]MCF6372059.1 COP23 domain-containing protein [Tychonema sp. BBK16]